MGCFTIVTIHLTHDFAVRESCFFVSTQRNFYPAVSLYRLNKISCQKQTTGSTYNDAMENCTVDKHCPTGDHAECPEGLSCFSFLNGCNYVDMVGGPGNVTITSGGNATKLDADDPTRSNYW